LSGELHYPTPYADVNAVLLDFETHTRRILDQQFVGLYLYGSLALGDFDPHTSDIDWIVVTQGEISADIFAALKAMHAAFNHSDSPWAGKIEAAYIPMEALNRPASTSEAYPQIEKGTELFRTPLEIGWAFQRYSLREFGLVVAGPEPRSIMDTVDVDDMKRAGEVIAKDWMDHAQQDPTWIDWARQRSALSFVVLTLCRILYSMAAGSVASKPAAARWARESLGGRWDTLIQSSLAGQKDVQEAVEADLQGMLALLSYTVEQFQLAGHQVLNCRQDCHQEKESHPKYQ
jgi:hypothetical protein